MNTTLTFQFINRHKLFIFLLQTINNSAIINIYLNSCLPDSRRKVIKVKSKWLACGTKISCIYLYIKVNCKQF